MKRDNCFDFLRFIFAFNVVLGHLTVIALFPQLQQYHFLFNTYLSVTGFFVISGFLIAQSYERSSLKSYFIWQLSLLSEQAIKNPSTPMKPM